ncbi:MAG: hypothetical protein ACREQB_10490 [Candidatus Binataceae bacterium]
MPVRETIFGLVMVAATALWFYYLARKRYRCPFCGRNVKWDDVNCRHCGSDMEGRHRMGGMAQPRFRVGRPTETPGSRRARKRRN